MSQYFLDIPDIDISLQQACGKGMAEHMWSDMQVNRRKRRVPVDHSADSLIRQLFTILICEKVPAALYFRPEIRFIPLQNTDNIIISNLHLPFFRTLSID